MGRRLLLLLAVGAALVFLVGKPDLSQTQTASLPVACSKVPTPAQTEGPYYKTGSPERKNIANGVPGKSLTLTGYVFDKNCNPIQNAWLDFWQADSSGQYDNTGFRLRGYQYTDTQGKYTLETIVPGAYEARPPHIHVKVKAPNGTVLTSQLYFPDEGANQKDSIFNPALIIKTKDRLEGKSGTFDFVLN